MEHERVRRGKRKEKRREKKGERRQKDDPGNLPLDTDVFAESSSEFVE